MIPKYCPFRYGYRGKRQLCVFKVKGHPVTYLNFFPYITRFRGEWSQNNFWLLTDHFWLLTDHFRSLINHLWSLTYHFWSLTDHFRSLTDHFLPLPDHFRPLTDHFRPLTDHFRSLPPPIPHHPTGKQGGRPTHVMLMWSSAQSHTSHLLCMWPPPYGICNSYTLPLHLP